MPTSWDETRVLAGDIGQYIVTARRSGDTWYIGAMGNEQARTVTVPMAFLDGRSYTAHIYQDGADINHLALSDTTLNAGQNLTLSLAPSGGGVAVLTPRQAGKRK